MCEIMVSIQKESCGALDRLHSRTHGHHVDRLCHCDMGAYRAYIVISQKLASESCSKFAPATRKETLIESTLA